MPESSMPRVRIVKFHGMPSRQQARVCLAVLEDRETRLYELFKKEQSCQEMRRQLPKMIPDGMTQTEVAENHLGVDKAQVSKMYKHGTITIENLIQLMSTLNLDWDDLGTLSPGPVRVLGGLRRAIPTMRTWLRNRRGTPAVTHHLDVENLPLEDLALLFCLIHTSDALASWISLAHVHRRDSERMFHDPMFQQLLADVIKAAGNLLMCDDDALAALERYAEEGQRRHFCRHLIELWNEHDLSWTFAIEALEFLFAGGDRGARLRRDSLTRKTSRR